MKKLLLNILFLLFVTEVFSQGTCATALPFCTGSNYTFPASINTPAPPGTNFGCLGTQPNPAFYYMEIANPGNLTIYMSTTPQRDIDFICWGPFTNFNTMCAQLNTAPIEDCSYSASWNETCQINGAVTGEYYLLLITNYSNQNCNISFSQTGGNGTTNCCIIAGNAGDDNALSICQNDTTFSMFNQILGSPNVGGLWYDPSNSIFGNFNVSFDPSINSSGTYSYIVQGTTSCPDDTSFLDVTVNQNPNISFSLPNTICSNEDDIILNATPSGGNYLGNISNNAILNLNNIGVNTVTYIYSDTNNCADTSIQNILIYDAPDVVATSNNTSCFGYNDGQITLTISGGTQPITQNWGGMNPLLLFAGSYPYTVTDTNNCFVSDTVNVYEPPGFSTNINTVDVLCNGQNNGSAEITFQIDNYPNSYGTESLLNYCTSNPGTNTFSNIKDVQLTGDNVSINNNTSGLCDSYEDYTSQYADLTQGQSYTLYVSTGDCNGFNFSSGGYAYIDWNSDGDFLDLGEEIGTIPFGDTITNNSIALPFTVPMTGSYGPTRLRIMTQFSSQSSILNMTSCDIGLFNQNTSTYVEPWYGATEDYSITIYPDTTNQTFLWSNSQTTDSIINLTAGLYTVSTNSNGCTTIDSIFINEPPLLTATTNISNVSCSGGTDGSITFNINGGSSAYILNVNNTIQSLSQGITTYSTPSSLSAGAYPYTITDNNGCVIQDTAYVIESIAISLIESINNVSCYGGNNGSIDLSISGGTGPFSFLWNNTDTTEDISNLIIGIYSYTITDALGCTFTDTVSVNQPSPIYVSDSITNVSCAGGNNAVAILNISGGITPYSENWGTNNPLSLNAGTHQFIVTDDNGCNYIDSITITEPAPLLVSYIATDALCNGVANGTAILNISGGVSPYSENWGLKNPLALAAGIHQFIITDNNGCTLIDSVLVNEPSPIGVVIDTNSASCSGFSDGSASLNIFGGIAPYLEDWGANNPLALNVGTYNFTVTDSNNCIYQGQAVISEPNPIAVNEFITDVSCFGLSDGVVLLQITGGTAPYNQDWSGNDPLALAQGGYSYTITDTNGCSLTDFISINQPNELLATANTNNVSCYGYSDGNAALNITGGTTPYSENWGGNNPLALLAGTYNYIITDNQGCQFIDDIVITQPNKILADYSVESPICAGDPSAISINIINTTANQYTIEINDQNTTTSYVIDSLGNVIIDNNQILLYPNQTIDATLISITDIFGCVSIINEERNIIVDQIPVLSINLNDVCESNPSFILNQANPQGGTYYVNDKQTSIFNIDSLPTGDYIITYEYTDPLTSCNNSIQEIISLFPSPKASFILSPQPADLDDPNIRFVNTSEDFTNLIWNLGENQIVEDEADFIYTYSDTGTYTAQLIIVNQYNCTDTISQNLIINPVYSIFIPSSFTPNEDDKNEVFEPVINAAQSYIMKIYDRWGGVIYQAENQGWDGKNVPSGQYFYSIDIIDFKNKIEREVGQITLVK